MQQTFLSLPSFILIPGHSLLFPVVHYFSQSLAIAPVVVKGVCSDWHSCPGPELLASDRSAPLFPQKLQLSLPQKQTPLLPHKHPSLFCRIFFYIVVNEEPKDWDKRDYTYLFYEMFSYTGITSFVGCFPSLLRSISLGTDKRDPKMIETPGEEREIVTPSSKWEQLYRYICLVSASPVWLCWAQD